MPSYRRLGHLSGEFSKHGPVAAYLVAPGAIEPGRNNTGKQIDIRNADVFESDHN